MADADPIRPVSTPFRTTQLVRRRAIEAVLGQSGVNHAGLATEIRRQFGSVDPAKGALVREPVVEGAAPFETDGMTFGDCAGTLLHSEVVRAIGSEQAEPYRFPPEAMPYKHQIAAWRALTSEERRSVLVSSGTGSGKTECFLMPLLHDLASEADRVGRLSGVRALALYPLNALIASQEERLSAWTRPFSGRIRFGLYNGMTPETPRGLVPKLEQVLDRQTLRRDPPPILVTNVTMLEYMTVRRVDQPLIENSRGSLRWIILDEAHSYVGSAAAEIALLIRRVLLAFGVRAQDVRFVATSATIGGGATDVTDELRRFLRDLSGADESRVSVVLGSRAKVHLPTVTDLALASTFDLDAVAANRHVQSLVRRLEDGPVGWDAAERMLAPIGHPAEALLEAIAATDEAHKDPLLPLRVHSFIRAVPGLWSCLNPECADAPEGWAFGAIAAEQVDECSCCRAPVLAVMTCRECGEPHLDAAERDGRLQQRVTPNDEDEFAAAMQADRESEERSPDEEPATVPLDDFADEVRRALTLRVMTGTALLHVDPATGQVHRLAAQGTRAMPATDGEFCAACRAHDSKAGPVLRPFRFGAPFLIGNAAPVMIDGVPRPSIAVESGFPPPAEGRQLLSFTDSRQGTARFAANIQTNAERGWVRGYVYHAVQGSMSAADASDPEVAVLRKAIAELEPLTSVAAAIADEVARKRAALDKLLSPNTDGIPWLDMQKRLAQADSVGWMRRVWGLRDDRYRDSPLAFAEFLLLREFARRPRRANTAETMGLARLRWPPIERIGEERVPASLRKRGYGAGVWRDVLTTLVDQVVRQNVAIRASWEDLHWLGPKVKRKVLLEPRAESEGSLSQPWPSVGKIGKPGNVAMLLETMLHLDRSEPRDRAELNAILREAWDQLQPLVGAADQESLALDFTKATIAPVVEAFLCPVTRRVLAHAPFGRTPYGQRDGLATAELPAAPITMPRLPVTFPRGADVETLRAWTDTDPTVMELRMRGVWNALHDGVALLSPYLRAAEHSAQQPANRLRRFETEFKAGEINVLNCSTTMEMGVDIGSVSAVMMTNVPPALANYRQRVGRAGRRRQGFASSLTYTRDTPLDREAFRDSIGYLCRETRAPRVKLDSRRIVQRHINALLLARWFAGEGGEALRTGSGEFFGCPADIGADRIGGAPAVAARAWMGSHETIGALADEVKQLTDGTVLAGDQDLHSAAVNALLSAEAAFVREWEGLQSQALTADKAATAGLGYQLRRLVGENLLKELAVRTVLPGHGFPTNVVQFIHSDKPATDDQSGGDGAPARRRNYPSRNLDIAIRDYAPGAEVVVDGLVYRSAGVTLNWTRPADDAEARQVQSIKTFWSCPDCGAADIGHAVPEQCPTCRGDIPLATRRRFLEPAGFVVDMADKEHADTDEVRYIEPEREQIVARGAAWQSLPDPAQGRLRATHDGLVFYSSMGATKGGYWICLECGRAEPGLGGHERPLAGHRPLRGTRRGTDGMCPGNDKPFKILSPLALGHEVVTDVAELQPSGIVQAGAAWALISALREALARQLGVEAGEMGLSVRAAKGPLGQPTHSLFLYDRNAGGAGFAPQAVARYEELLGDAERRLDCQQPGCVRGCSACVLTADLHKQQEIIDRRPALELVRGWRAGLAKPSEEDRVTQDARFSSGMVDEIAAAVEAGARAVTIWPGAGGDVAALSEPGFARFARALADRASSLTVVVPPDWLDALDPAARLALRDAAQARPFVLRQGSAPAFANGAVALAAVDNPRELWVSRDTAAAVPYAAWGQGRAAPVVRVAVDRLPLSAGVDLTSLLPASGTSYLEIAGELDGTVSGFGTRLVSLISPALRQAGLTGPVTAIRYADRYLSSPLVMRLALDTVAALRDTFGATGVLPVTLLCNALRGNDRQPFAPDHDWSWEDDRRVVAVGLAEHLGLAATLDERGAPHGRELLVEHGGGRVRIVLDQGFGAWVTPRFARFDFGDDGTRQVEKLAKLSVMLTARGRSYVVVAR
jgi:DEAD/DEAH box helicase domain-containing protein